MISMRQMEVFHAIMRTGSVTAAARLLNVSQPAVTAVLKHTEARLNIQLFTRIAGRLQPTPEARAIYPDVAAIYARVDAVGRLMQDLAGGRLGTLSIAAAFPVASGYLARAVAEFTKARPQARVALQSLTSPEVLDRVISREVELGVAYEPIVNPEVETTVLARTTVACVLRDDHPLACEREIRPADLEPFPIITYLPRSLMRMLVDRALSEASVAPQISIQVGLALTGIMLAAHGAGVALVEPSLLDSIAIPGVVTRPLRPRVQVRTLLVRGKSAPRSKLMDDFISHLKRTAAEVAN